MSETEVHRRESAVRRTLRFVTGKRRPHAPAPALAGPPLICLSHREPFTQAKNGGWERTTGGLVSALDGVLRQLGGRWVATGETDRSFKAPGNGHASNYDIRQLALSATEQENYYAGFSNRVLWPLFHYFIGRVNFQVEEWDDYVKVNQRLANAVVEELSRHPGQHPVAWIHDYHLLMTPRMIRAARPKARIGFFLHTPFPAFEVFRILPTRRELLEGMLGADLLGFQTHNYLDAFLDTVRRLLGARVDKSGAVEYQGHRTQTLASPIGIDVDQQLALAEDPRVLARAHRLKKGLSGQQLIIGVDRLDYSKGIPERLAGFERLLERHPEHRGRVTLFQIAVPSRTRVEDYRQLKRVTDEAVGRINGRFGDAVWTPVHYLSRSLQPAELTSYYQAADVALVTPLRDGLNLVAKEYVASHSDLGGALVLSEFAGAADELPHAYFINPFGPDSIADALHAALTDDRAERERRMSSLLASVRANDVQGWARSFLQHLARATD